MKSSLENQDFDLHCQVVFIGSPTETAVNLFGLTFQGYPLNLDMCKINISVPKY